MKSISLKSSLLTLLMLLSTSMFAGEYLGNGKITMLQSHAGGWLIKTDGANNASSGQCSPEKSILFLNPSMSNFDQVFSLILAAYTTGKKLNINVNGCTDNGDYNKFSFVYSEWNR